MVHRLIVVTDLDGTLLDHHSYEFDAARPALDALRRARIPLILNSSKTAAEISVLRERLGNRWPYIVENGAGIHVPDPQGSGDVQRIGFGMARDAILAIMHRLRDRHDYRFTGFADMDAQALVALTGLEPEQARQALDREFTEPLVWEDSEERYVTFCASLREAGLSITRGGRFTHVSARCNKGTALEWLRDHYRSSGGGEPLVIALGDGENDTPMLEAADYPVVVRSPVNPPPRVHHPGVMLSREIGPEGWNTCVLALLQRLAA